jgi:hypothetical protein
MDIKKTFLSLTSRTYPNGTEKNVFHLLNPDLNEDEFGNLFIRIGETTTLFTCHLDTATTADTTVTHVFEGNIIKTDGKSILGADDKAGVTIMLYMIENKIPGLYYFFLGEEVGCQGSRKVANKFKNDNYDGIKKVVAFDRKDNNSVITFKGYQRGCSDTFAISLCKELNDADSTFSYKTDDSGGSTDSFQFMDIIPECTNISVGYNYEHTYAEKQDIVHLDKLAKACLKVKWEKLPVERNNKVAEYKKYNSNITAYSMHDDYTDYTEYNASNTARYWKTPKDTRIKSEKTYFQDKKFNYVSMIEMENNKVIGIDLCEDRIEYEKMLIENLLESIELGYLESTWDGLTLKVKYELGHFTETNRNELFEYLPELKYIDEIQGFKDGYKGRIIDEYEEIDYTGWPVL